ncbi:MAG: hypothetical protein IK118_00125 [Clostridia bacterium]|nr:hypothetical protein [Clostridia bacterium]
MDYRINTGCARPYDGEMIGAERRSSAPPNEDGRGLPCYRRVCPTPR